MLRKRLPSFLAAATSAATLLGLPASAQQVFVPPPWSSVPLPGQESAAVPQPVEVAAAAPAAVPLPRPAPRRAKNTTEDAPSPALAAAAEDGAAAPAPAPTVLAYAGGDERFSFLSEPQQAVPAMNGAVAEPGGEATAAPVPLPRTAPSRIGALSSPVGGDTASRMAGRGSFAAPRSVPGELADLIATKAREHGVPLALAHAVIRVESNYNPRVTGRGGPIGLMQIKHQTARGLGFRGTSQELFEPATNLEWGMRYLSGAHKLAKGDLCHTVMKYQGGHYTMQMTRAASVYCGKVKTYMAVAQ